MPGMQQGLGRGGGVDKASSLHTWKVRKVAYKAKQLRCWRWEGNAQGDKASSLHMWKVCKAAYKAKQLRCWRWEGSAQGDKASSLHSRKVRKASKETEVLRTRSSTTPAR